MSSKFGSDEPVSEWSRKIGDIMDEMLNRSFVQYKDSGAWQPATDVFESRTSYFICVELAGMEKQDIDVECLDDRRVLVSGRRKQPRPSGMSGPLSVHVLEIDEGPFQREIDLPEPVKVDQVEAGYSKGYLWITLPKNAKS